MCSRCCVASVGIADQASFTAPDAARKSCEFAEIEKVLTRAIDSARKGTDALSYQRGSYLILPLRLVSVDHVE